MKILRDTTRTLAVVIETERGYGVRIDTRNADGSIVAEGEIILEPTTSARRARRVQKAWNREHPTK